MPSKVVRSLSDENPDLHKQIGCMNTIFHHFLTGRRQITGQPHNRLPSGQNGNRTKDSKNASKNTTEINQKKTVKEKQRISTESSRTSFSSSTCSSTLSLTECNRASQLETCSLSQTSVPEPQVREPPAGKPNASSRSPDLRDVVKDSIYREARGLLVKTISKGENKGQTLKYFDSPRPTQQPKRSGSKESIQVLQSPRERNHISPRRYSCDGRESRDTSKAPMKLKELPRLSLDSKAGSMRGSNNERKSDNLSFVDQQDEPESRTRLSNVVAKLMGLEVLPDATSAVENENKQTRVPCSPRNLHKEPSSPQMKNDSIKTSIPSSKFPIEPAPWKQPDGSTKGRLTQPKPQNTPLSVYGEIEKRLAQLEFKKSGKDLRALKQILEAMQKTKQVLETRNEDEKLGTRKSSNISLHQNLNLPNLKTPHNTNPISALTKSIDSPKSSIVIMKPRLTRLSQNSKGQRQLSQVRESTNSDKNSATLNIRQSQKKLGLEKQTRPANLSSDLIKSRRLSSRQPTESGSPRRKPRPRPTSLQLTDDELSDIGSDARDLSCRTDSMSLLSESASLASQYDEEVSSIDRSIKIKSNIQQSYQRQKPVGRLVKDRSVSELTIPSSEQPSPVSVLDATFYADDLPSPIKKKSIAFKDDNEWNPAEENRLYSTADYSLNSVIDHKKAETIRFIIQNFIQMLSAEKESSLSIYTRTNPEHQYISEILSASGFLKDFESGFTPIHISQIGYPISPDVFLALEQVKASTTLSSDKETTKALKLQSKKRKLVFDVVNELLADKFHPESPYKQYCAPNTRLLGDLCSEVDRLQGNTSNFNLDDEDDTLAGILEEDLRRQSTQWSACSSEIPGLVLDVERLIFKDLITEVVTCETLWPKVAI